MPIDALYRELARLRACEDQLSEVIGYLNDKKVPAGPLLYRLSLLVERSAWA